MKKCHKDESNLTNIERDRLLRVRQALKDNGLVKKEINLTYTDLQKLKQKVIRMNKLLEHVKITGIIQYRNMI